MDLNYVPRRLSPVELVRKSGVARRVTLIQWYGSLVQVRKNLSETRPWHARGPRREIEEVLPRRRKCQNRPWLPVQYTDRQHERRPGKLKKATGRRPGRVCRLVLKVDGNVEKLIVTPSPPIPRPTDETPIASPSVNLDGTSTPDRVLLKLGMAIDGIKNEAGIPWPNRINSNLAMTNCRHRPLLVLLQIADMWWGELGNVRGSEF